MQTPILDFPKVKSWYSRADKVRYATVLATDLHSMPHTGQQVRLEGVIYTVEDCAIPSKLSRRHWRICIGHQGLTDEERAVGERRAIQRDRAFEAQALAKVSSTVPSFTDVVRKGRQPDPKRLAEITRQSSNQGQRGGSFIYGRPGRK